MYICRNVPKSHGRQGDLSPELSHDASSEHTCTALRSDSGPSKRDGPKIQLSTHKRAKPKPFASSNMDESIARLLGSR